MTTIVTLATEEMRDVWQMCAKTWNPYCAAHGYFLRCYTEKPYPSMAPSWNKIPILLSESKYATGPVWWIDSDMLVLDLGKPLPEPSKSIWVSTDWNGICCGMMGCRGDDWARSFLNAVMFVGDVKNPDDYGMGCGVKWEQNAIKGLVKEFPSVKSGIEMLPESMVADKPPFAAQIAHLGARSNQERLRLGNELMNRRKK